MPNHHSLFRCALLGSALAIIALTPAAGANASRDDLKRIRAIEGNHAFASRPKSGAASGFSATNATYTVLHQFAGGSNDGSGSGANVTLDDAGNIYGTTDFGGAHSDGVVFKLAPDGTQTLLHSFAGSDGAAPDGGVVVLSNGTLYGTAGSGGAGGNGVLFTISKKGKYKVLHDFSSNDGSFLRGDLIRDKLGNLYGTALFGGVNGDGTVFKYGFDGTFTVLHAFNGTDGEFPEHGVVSDKAGNLYGVTAFGGASDNGSVYKIASDGTFTTLYSFTGGADGGFLYGGLDIDKDGNLYGSTVDGGANASGTVFKLTPGGTLDHALQLHRRHRRWRPGRRHAAGGQESVQHGRRRRRRRLPLRRDLSGLSEGQRDGAPCVYRHRRQRIFRRVGQEQRRLLRHHRFRRNQ